MNRDTEKTPPPETMLRILERLLSALQARCSYSTRVWTALILPILAGTVLGWSTQRKFEGLLLGVLVVIVYTLALSWNKHRK